MPSSLLDPTFSSWPTPLTGTPRMRSDLPDSLSNLCFFPLFLAIICLTITAPPYTPSVSSVFFCTTTQLVLLPQSLCFIMLFSSWLNCYHLKEGILLIFMTHYKLLRVIISTNSLSEPCFFNDISFCDRRKWHFYFLNVQ